MDSFQYFTPVSVTGAKVYTPQRDNTPRKYQMAWIFSFGTLVTVFPGELCGCRTRRIPGGGSLFPGLEQAKRRDPQASVHKTLPARALLLQYGLWRAVKRSFSARESVWGTVLLPFSCLGWRSFQMVMEIPWGSI